MNTPYIYLSDPQDPSLLSSMDPAQIAAAVQHCPIPLDSALQVSAWGPLDADPVYQVTKQSSSLVILLCFVHF